MKKHIALLCLLLTEAVFFASWPTTLYLDGGGRWDYRKPIFFENKGAEDIVGESVAIKIPQDAPFIGQAAGLLVGKPAAKVLITADPDEAIKDADCTVDFSAPGSTMTVAKKAAAKGAAMVIGTTGWYDIKEEVFAAFESAPAALSTRVYGAWNCYFPTNNFVGENAGATIGGEDTCQFASDEGFTVSSARNKLNSFAVPAGYETWIRGRKGPELSCFADPFNPETVIVVR